MTREEALKELRYMLNVDISLYGKKNNPKPNRKALEFAIKFLESEKPKGEWKIVEEIDGRPVCSVCNKCANVGLVRDYVYYIPNFCPNCGADMRGSNT